MKCLNLLGAVLASLLIVISFPGLKASDSGASAQTATIEGPFGKTEIDLVAPSMTRLYLRDSSGNLTAQSILSTEPGQCNSLLLPWTRFGYTYVIGADGRRYESKLATPDAVDVSGENAQKVIKITGIKLIAAAGEAPVATEDWTLSAPGDGKHLVWKITRHWQKDFSTVLSASPSLFLTFGRTPATKNSATTTMWYDPLRLAADPGPDSVHYAEGRDRNLSDNHLVTIRDRDSWTIYKLWTNWHAPVDLRLEVRNGYLYRRDVSYGLASEAGAMSDFENAKSYHQGETAEVSLAISGADRSSTGYQLSVDLPDKPTENSLKDFYSLLNGGMVCDQKDFDFGNESDGVYYAGECWMSGVAMEAGVPAPGALSAHPYQVYQAYREHLSNIFSVVDGTGRAHFGYNASGIFIDDDLSALIGARIYLLHSGDLPFIRQNLVVMEKMLDYFVQNRNKQGLFQFRGINNYWYYDAMLHGELVAYHNAFFYEASLGLAEMEGACGHKDKADEYTALAASIKKAFNEVFWKENAPGGPRYIDWIYADGRQVTYFCDICQWPALAFGLASPEQGRKLIATADARIAELEKEYGYKGYATLAALWPAPHEAISTGSPGEDQFGRYMNGGSLLAQTYWEVLARARYGDPEGAARRLKLFAQRASEISWVGNNSASIKGTMEDSGGDGELYLADMVATTASLINGVMGINPTWDHLEITPHLPADWPKASANVLYKGRMQHVTIENGNARVQPGEQVIPPGLVWLMDFNLHNAPTGPAVTSNLDFLGDNEDKVRLSRVFDDQNYSSFWKLDETSGPVIDSSPHQTNGEIKGTGTVRGAEGHAPGGKSSTFDGHGYVEFAPDDTVPWLKDRSSSFTLQCWFKTNVVQDKQMFLVFKGGAYGFNIVNGKLSATLTDEEQDGIAHGTTLVADGKWHHAAALYDRKAQRVTLYLDGKLDTPNGQPNASQNPGDLTPLGVSAAYASVSLAGGYGVPSFIGSLADVSLTRGLLTPAEFSFQQKIPTPLGKPGFAYAASGTYQSPPYDWGEPAQLTDLMVTTDLHGGQVNATVETSNDNFKTVGSSADVPIRDGVNTYSLSSIKDPSQMVRVRFTLKPGADPMQSPVVDGFRITVQPNP
jgi:hypothetical protein